MKGTEPLLAYTMLSAKLDKLIMRFLRTTVLLAKK